VDKDSAPSILVQGLDPRIVERLKERARVNRRSPEQEIKEILERDRDAHTARGATTIGTVEAPAEPAVTLSTGRPSARNRTAPGQSSPAGCRSTYLARSIARLPVTRPSLYQRVFHVRPSGVASGSRRRSNA
jgi:hypothetical protein